MNGRQIERIIRRWLYIVVVTLAVVIVGHHAMTYVIVALTFVKEVCDWARFTLLDSAGGFLVYAIAVAAVLIYIEKHKVTPTEQEKERRQRTPDRESVGFFSKIRKRFASKKFDYYEDEFDEARRQRVRRMNPRPAESTPAEETHTEKQKEKTTEEEAPARAPESKREVEVEMVDLDSDRK